MDSTARITEIDAAVAPLREQYEAAKKKRREVADRIAKLVDEEKQLILELNQVSDQLEAYRLEKLNLLDPPRKKSRQRKPRP